MGLFGKGRPGLEIAPGYTRALIQRRAARTNDALRIPAGWEAIFVHDGAFSPVLREGDGRLPSEGRRTVEGGLYFIRLAPEDVLDWGCGGVQVGARTCGLHGTLRMEVVSSRKLLAAFIGEAMPFPAGRAYERLLGYVLDAVRTCTRQVAQASGTPAGMEPQIADAARKALEGPFEQYGLAVASLTVEGIFIAPEAQEA